jgi:DNA (cytosine-5)-methyltransferase 1
MMLTFGSLFSGMGGMDLGLERAGMRCMWQVELDDYARRILAKHWPDVRRHDDIRTFPPGNPDDWRCDLIAGGFPCVDISSLGRRGGITGDAGSGLWKEMFRVVCLLRPRLLLVENVAEMLIRGMDVVLGDMAAGGYDAAWQCLPAAALGAGHLRDRVFILGVDRNAVFLNGHPLQAFSTADPLESGRSRAPGWREAESRMGRSVDGVPNRVDRLRALGNAVVPQVAQYIGRRIMEAASCPPP